MSRFKRLVSLLTTVTTLFWSLGLSTLIPNVALAATIDGPFELIPFGGFHVPASSFDNPVARFALTKSASETLSSVAVSLTNNTGGAVTDNVLANHITSISIWKDNNGNNTFEPQNDLFVADTGAYVRVATSTNTITTSSNNTFSASGTLANSFFVAIKTGSGWASPDSFKVSIAAGGIVTSANTLPAISFSTTNAVDANTAGFGGGIGFGVDHITFVNGTTVDVAFTDTLDLNSGNATSTSNYTLSGTGAASVTSVIVLPDNKSVRLTAATASLVGTGGSLLAVSAGVKNTFGIANATTAATPCFNGFQPLVVSEVKIGTNTDQYDEFIELYNRTGSDFTATSSLKLHFVNAAGTNDQNVPLTWNVSSTAPGARARGNGFLLIAPVSSPASSTADAVYTTSTVRSLVANGAAYISNSTASSTAVIDKVCWGSHPAPINCEGSSVSAYGTTDPGNGTSLERKAVSGSTATSLATGGADATNGNGYDTQNNSFDFVIRTTPQPQAAGDLVEAPTGGFWGGSSNGAPNIQHAPIFRATTSTAFTLIARMTDDGGLLTPSNTQLIFCTTSTASCTPASSTPIFGTSIGSGWFKFSSTSTDWAFGRPTFKYYLQASDSASPAKTKVFTNDPSFDSTESNVNPTGGVGGIQTATLQGSKAISLVLAVGNLGSAAITGTVKDFSQVAVAGATVWLEGTQFSATTGNDGNFSLSNLGPSGGKLLKVAKDGFVDQSMSIFVPTSGLVSLGTLTLFSGTMGSGGDFNQPKITSSNPPSGSNTFPTQSPSGGAPPLTLNFSKAMDTTTYVTSTAGNATSNIYLTEAGSSTRIAGAVTAPSTTQAIFTPSAALTAGKGYTLFVTPAVKDSSGNPVGGNGPGGVYVLFFSTGGAFFSDFSSIGTGGTSAFGMGSSFPPFVQGGQPSPGKQGVALNSKAFVTFSEAMQNSSSNLANVKLYQVTSPFTASESKSLITATNSLDTSGKIITITPSGNLTASAHYRVEVLGGISSAKGIPLGNPTQTGFATTAFYKSDFDTGTATDMSAPTVSGTIPAADATGVSTTKPVVVNFSESMDPSTITASSLTVGLGSNAVSGQLSYDPNTWKATFTPDYALTATSTYTITVTTDVKDLAGNALATSLRSFTTGSADTAKPTVVSAQGNEFATKVVYSKPMLAVGASDLNYGNSVINPSNYLIKKVDATGATLATITLPSTATLSYDAPGRSVAITGLPATSGISVGALLNIKASNVKDVAFNDLDLTGNAATSTAQSSAMTGGFSGGFGPFQDASGNNIQGGSFGPPPNTLSSFSSGFNIGFIPSAKVLPQNPTAGATSIYSVEVPISKQIAASGFIDVTFPEGVDVSSATQDPNSPKNLDINGPSTGTVVFGTSEGTLPSGWVTGGTASDGVIVNTTSRTVRVILGAVATRSESSDTHDFLRFDIGGVVNSSITSSIETAGNSATVATNKSDGTVLENFTSGSFFTIAGGSSTIRGVVTSTTNGINGVTVFLMSPLTGRQTTTTLTNRFGGNDGEFMFQGLNDGFYMVGVDQFFRVAGTDYTASFPTPVTVNSTSCSSNICSRNISVTNASTGATLTLNISGTFAAGGDAVDIFAGGPGAFRMVTSTLTGTLTNNTANTIKLNANGKWFVGFGPSLKGGMFNAGGPASPPAWIVPKPQEVTVSGCPGACAVTPTTLSFSSAAANKTIKFTVQDASGSKIGQAFVFAYAPGGLGSGGPANADGTGSLSMATGTFKIGASVPGLPPGTERTIDLKSVNSIDKVFIDGSSTGISLSAMTASDLVLVVSKPSYTITGKVTDGTNAVANAPVSAFLSNGQGHADTFTNSSGEYTLYVNNGTWKVTAFLPQQYGKLSEKTITVSGASVSGQNFQPDTATNYATIVKSVGADANADGAINAGEGLANVQVTVQGTTAGGQTYLNTVLTDGNGSSTLKVPPGTYTMKAWSPTLGDLSTFSGGGSLVVNSAGTATTVPSDLTASSTATVIINVLDSNGNATTTDKMAIEFEQIGGKTDNTIVLQSASSTSASLTTFDIANNIAIGSVTSTNPANFYLMKITTPGIANNSITVAGGASTVLATSTAASGLYKVEVDGTETINIRLPDVNYMSGTVKDDSGNAVANANVHIENKSTGEVVEVKADSSGNYTTKLSSGNYLVQGDKAGYFDTATSVSVTASSTLADALTTMTAANLTITGTITTGGSAVSGATVRASKLGGGVVSATTGADGTYTLKVAAGDWKVAASADGYTETQYSSVVNVATSNVSSINISLSSTSTSLAGSTAVNVTPQTGGTLVDTSANSSIKAPSTAISRSPNNFSLGETETSNVVTGGSGKPIAGEAKSITSYNSDGSLVTTLDNNVTVSASYSTADLASSLGTLTVAKVEKVKMSSLDKTIDNWENLPTTIAYKDSSGNFLEPSSNLSNVASVAFTGQTTHFSVFNPTSPSDGLAPSTPGGLGALGGSNQITLTWVAPSTNADGSSISDLLGYEIYRSTSAGGTYTQLNTSDITSASYTDTGLAAGTTYYYKVTAADTGGLESAMSAAVSGLTTAAIVGGGGGGGGGGGTPTVTSDSLSINSGAQATVSQQVTLTLSSANATQMVISNDANFTGASFETFAASKSWTLTSGFGKKIVYAKFRSGGGAVSGVVAAEINLIAVGQVPAPVVTTPTAPAAGATVTRPVVTPTPANAYSDIHFLVLPSTNVVKTGQSVRFTFDYVNTTDKTQKIILERQMISPKGKVVDKAAGQRVVKSGAQFQSKVTQAVSPKLDAGAYTVVVRVKDAKTKARLEENSFQIIVEKSAPPPKKPVPAKPKPAPPKPAPKKPAAKPAPKAKK